MVSHRAIQDQIMAFKVLQKYVIIFTAFSTIPTFRYVGKTIQQHGYVKRAPKLGQDVQHFSQFCNSMIDWVANLTFELESTQTLYF